MRTFIRRPGNKTKHLKYLLGHFPMKYNRYIEPFVGTGSVLLKLQPEKWIINDLNKDVANSWMAIKSNVESMIKIFQSFKRRFDTEDNNEKMIYAKQVTDKLSKYIEDDVKRATYFIIANYVVYMGMFNKSNNGYGFGCLDIELHSHRLPTCFRKTYHDNLRDISRYITQTNGKIFNKDYKTILSKAKTNDFVFLDPPYIEQHSYGFEYNHNKDVDAAFLDNLKSEVEKLDRKNVKWLMTQSDTHYVRSMFSKYQIIEYPVYRRNRKIYTNELIIKNF